MPRAVLDRARTIAAILLVGVVAAPALAAPESLDFARREVQQRGPADRTRWGATAGARGGLIRVWNRYNQRGEPPRIRFGKRFAVVAGTGGSSSCPTRLHDLRLHRGRERIVVRVYTEDPGEGNGCTDDFVPKTFTVSVARADLEPLHPRDVKVVVRRISDPDG